MIEEKLLRLERMSSAEKIRYWGQEKPWEINDTRLRLPAIRPFGPGQVEVIGGHIARTPLPIGRPCYGQPAAFMRHGGERFVYSPRQRTYQPTRCARCPIRKSCEFVAEERLRSTPKLAELYREWRNLGGRDQTWPAKGTPGTAAVHLRALLAELRTMTFTSVRDQEIQDHYKQIIDTKLTRDRERKRHERERQAIEKAKGGEMTPALHAVLNGHRTWRAVEHRKAGSQEGAPKWLRLLPPDASMFDANVWLAHTRVWLRGDAPKAYSCAAELHRMGIEVHRSVNALRDRVARSMRRLQQLERLYLDDSKVPVWPRFTLADLKDGLRYQLPTE